jgi:hypothetical protein
MNWNSAFSFFSTPFGFREIEKNRFMKDKLSFLSGFGVTALFRTPNLLLESRQVNQLEMRHFEINMK